MVTNKVTEAAKTAKKPAPHTPVGAEFIGRRARRRARNSTTIGELASVGTLGANIITSSRREKPNYRAPASVGTLGELAIESDARAPDTDRDPPTSGTLDREEEPPPPLSALAVRLIDGAIFVSVQDAPADVDLRGREVLTFMRLNDDEILLARASFEEGHDDIVANIIGRLPGRST